MEANDPIPTLCRLLAEMRPGWSTEDVKGALYEPSVWRRPFPVVAAAAVLCASDPETEHPGRLRAPGPWWQRAGVTPSPPALSFQPLSEAQRAKFRETAARGAAACREALGVSVGRQEQAEEATK